MNDSVLHVGRRRRRAWICIAAGLLAGCAASQPVHFHTLMPTAEPTNATPPRPAFFIDVRPVSVPAQADRQPFVLRRGSEISLIENERWAAPLGDELRSAMSARLTHELGTEDVGEHVLASDIPVLRIRIDVRRFDAVFADHVSIDATWTMRSARGNGSDVVCSSEQRVAVASGYDALVEGYQEMLDGLAANIASSARRLMERSSRSCADS
jgi:uncharacterized lipoprotein YmbA